MESCCRACSRSDDFRRFSLYAVAEVSQEVIANMIRDTSDTQVSTEDGLPQHICPDCLMTLSLAYSFRKQCRRSEAKFREYWGRRTPAQSVDQQQQQQHQSQQQNLPRRSQSQVPDDSSFEAVATNIKEEVDIYDYEYSVPSVHDNQWVIQNPRTIGEGAMTVVHNTGGQYYDEAATSVEPAGAPDREGQGMIHAMDDAPEMGESSGLGLKAGDKLKKNVPNPERYSQRIRRQMPSTSRKRTRAAPVYLNWTDQQMTIALNAVQDGMSYRKASVLFNIPAVTLWDYAKRSGIRNRLKANKSCERDLTSTIVQPSNASSVALEKTNISHAQMSNTFAAVQSMDIPKTSMIKIPKNTIYKRVKHEVARPKDTYCAGTSPSRVPWTPEQMLNAVKAVENGMTFKKASTTFQIPSPTIWKYAKRSRVTGGVVVSQSVPIGQTIPACNTETSNQSHGSETLRNIMAHPIGSTEVVNLNDGSEFRITVKAEGSNEATQ